MALEDRVRALEREMEELHELVDGQEPWSHRKRLHALEGDSNSARLASQALRAYRREAGRGVREWGGFVLALAAVLIAFLR
jgi:hypothetical protein